jgi:hypothetical protein
MLRKTTDKHEQRFARTAIRALVDEVRERDNDLYPVRLYKLPAQ